jgi:radical SAM superfamily enzyme YgiQ (UPF0313 family)
VRARARGDQVKVLLISPPIMDVVDGRLRPVGVDAEKECPPVGLYHLAAALEAHGHEVLIADLVLEGTRSLARYDQAVDGADVVGIGATSMAWPTAVDVIKQVRARRPEVPIVCGGIHPTLFDRYVLTTFPVEFVVRGEGEEAIVALCAALQGEGALAEVPNLSWKDGSGAVVRNEIAPLIDRGALGELPLPDYGRLPAGGYKCLGLESSRGCAFDCSFCSTPYRRRWRALTTGAVVDRLEQVMQHLDRTRSGCVHIVDDEFALNPARATEIARLIKARGLHPRLLFDARAQDLLHDGLVASLAEYTVCLLIGAECGYDAGLERVGKGSTCATLEGAARVLHQHGIADRVDFSFILGLPWEGKEEVLETIRFATGLHAHYGVHVMMQWYRQIPGSRLWDEARQAGLVHEAMYDRYGFFRDLYLFRTSCRLEPREIYEIADLADQLRWLSDLPGEGRPSIVHHFPTPIAEGFPRAHLDGRDTGLHNLRELAHQRQRIPLKLEGVRS